AATQGRIEQSGAGSRALPAKESVPPEPASGPAMQRLLAWLSPSFPVGSFSYSHGLEWAIADGSVTTAGTLEAWLGGVLRHGAGWTDALLFAHAHRAATDDDWVALRELIELAAAFQPSKERHLEATAQGQAFLAAVAAAWPSEALSRRLVAIA